MEHDAIEDDTVRLSVPTRFLKSWVQSHYADKLLACWKAELPSIRRDRSGHALGGAAQRDRQGEAERAGRSRARDQERRRARRAARRAAAGAGRARGARRLAARSAARVRHLRGRPLQHARPCGRQAGRAGAARRAGDVQSALRPCGRRASARRTCCSRSPGPATASRTARCCISPPRSSCTASWRRSRRRPRSPSRKRCAASTCW